MVVVIDYLNKILGDSSQSRGVLSVDMLSTIFYTADVSLSEHISLRWRLTGSTNS